MHREEIPMTLWFELARCLLALAPACSRLVSFGWLCTIILGLCCRRDLAGVTSLVRAGSLCPSVYRRLLHLFHSRAVRLDLLTQAWLELVLRLFVPMTAGDRYVCLADGIQVGKEGKKMPAVKSLFNDSPNNSKSRFIMGHAFHAVSLLIQCGSRVLAIPLISRIDEGVVWPGQPTESRPRKLASLICQLWSPLQKQILLVADSYFAASSCIEPLRQCGHHIVTRVRLTAVGYQPAPVPRKRGRGRPRFFGKRVVLRNLFRPRNGFIRRKVEIYGEQVLLEYRSIDLIWKSLRSVVRFVLVDYPGRRAIFMTTDLTLSPEQIIQLYSYRFKIESGFKQAKQTLGAYSYHFWMMEMEPSRRGSADQNLESRAKTYREAVARKLDAYHRFVQAACIAQGLLLHLSVNYSEQVWASFKTWLRTIRPGVPASEAVVAESLRWTFFEIFAQSDDLPLPLKFLRQHADLTHFPAWLKRPA